MFQATRLRRLTAFTVVAAAACADSAPSLKRTAAEPERCTAHIIVGLKPTLLGVSSREIAAALSGGGIELEPGSRIAIDTYVFLLRSDEPDQGCRSALERVRRDARVLWAEMDERRKSHGEHWNSPRE